MKLKQLIPALILVFLTSFVRSQEVPQQSIYFSSDNAELTPKAQQLLDSIYNLLADGRSLIVGIVGDMDMSKTKLVNNQLCERRMNTAYDYLVAKGLDAKDITKTVKDKVNAVINGDYDKAKELYTYKLLIKKTVSTGKPTYTYNKLTQEYPKKPNCFIINPNNISNLTSYEGTVISIPRYCFIYETGEMVESDVTICFLEFYKESDILLGDLSLIGNALPLNSDGVIHISATANSRDIILAPPSTIILKIPARKNTPEMKLYEGVEKANNLTWKESQVPNTAINKQYNIFKIEKFGWFNCAATIEAINTGNLTVIVDSTYGQDVKLYFKDLNTVIKGIYVDRKTVVFNNLPIGQKAYLISYCYRNDIPAYCAKEITIAPVFKETLELKEITYKDLQVLLNNLK